MKKILGIVAVLMIVLSTMAYAGGDKNQGHTGNGTNSLGSAGNGTSPGNDAQGNQA